MNMQSIMQQAQKMQRDMQKKREEINQKLFPGKYEWVEVVFNGKKELVSIKINKEGSIDEEDKEMLEDMISLAIKDSIAAIDKEVADKLGSLGSSFDGIL